MVTAVFPAAGQGKRMQAGKNKVLLELLGKPILVHTLERFSASQQVDFLVVIVAEEEVAQIEQMLSEVTGLKPYVVVAGGSERQYSIANGLAAMPAETEIVLVHDAARPLVSLSVIENVIAAARAEGSAIAAVPEKNTIKVVDEEGFVKETPNRAVLWAVQTPQGFRKEILLEAYQRAGKDGFLGTDDASLVERMGCPVQVVASSYRNIKVTTPEDLLIAEAFMKEQEL